MSTIPDPNSRRDFLRHLAAALTCGLFCRTTSAARPESPEDFARQTLELLREDSAEAFFQKFDAASLKMFAAKLTACFASRAPNERERAAQGFGFASYFELKNADPRVLLKGLLDLWRQANPEAAALLRESRLKTLGSVIEEDRAYVPYRLLNAQGEWIDLRIHPRVLTLEREGDGWALQMETESFLFKSAVLANDYQLPPVKVEILGRLLDERHYYFVNRQSFSFPSGEISVVAANFANSDEDLLTAARADDRPTAASLIRAQIEDYYGGYLPLLKMRDEFAREIEEQAGVAE